MKVRLSNEGTSLRDCKRKRIELLCDDSKEAAFFDGLTTGTKLVLIRGEEVLGRSYFAIEVVLKNIKVTSTEATLGVGK